MFLENVGKCLKIFDQVYVSSDSVEILRLASDAGAIGILRGYELCGDVPDIPVFQHAFRQIEKARGIVAVHANNPTIEPSLISLTKTLLEMGAEEVMTCHPMSGNGPKLKYKDQSNKVYGSIRGMTRNRLFNYPDAYKPDPDVLLVDISREIETQSDYDLICDH